RRWPLPWRIGSSPIFPSTECGCASGSPTSCSSSPSSTPQSAPSADEPPPEPTVARALIVGGTGPIGRAPARRLLPAGWAVALTGRDPAPLPADIAAAGGRLVPAERDDADRLLAALGDGADLLVDCICYTADDATR